MSKLVRPLPPKPVYDKCNKGHQLVPVYNLGEHAMRWDCPLCIKEVSK